MTQVGVTSKPLPVTIMTNALVSGSPLQGKQAPGALYKAWTCYPCSLGGGGAYPLSSDYEIREAGLRNTPRGKK